MTEFRRKEDLLAERGFDAQIELLKKDGARVTPTQRGFIGEAVWQGYRRDQQHEPRAMTPAHRGVKKTLVDQARSSLTDLDLFARLFGGWGPRASGFNVENLVRAIPPERLARVVTAVCSASRNVGGSGKEYADPLLAVLADVYRVEGERIQVVRDMPGNPSQSWVRR